MVSRKGGVFAEGAVVELDGCRRLGLSVELLELAGRWVAFGRISSQRQ